MLKKVMIYLEAENVGDLELVKLVTLGPIVVLFSAEVGEVFG